MYKTQRLQRQPLTADQFDEMTFPTSRQPLHDDFDDIINNPLLPTAVEEEAIGHLSFSDISESSMKEELNPPPRIQPQRLITRDHSHSNQQNSNLQLSKDLKIQGNKEFEKKNYQEAIVNFSTALSLNPNDYTCYCR